MKMRFESLQVRLNAEYVINAMVDEQKPFDLDLFDTVLKKIEELCWGSGVPIKYEGMSIGTRGNCPVGLIASGSFKERGHMKNFQILYVQETGEMKYFGSLYYSNY